MRFALFLALLLGIGCGADEPGPRVVTTPVWSDIDLSSFEDAVDYQWSALIPGIELDYWEVRTWEQRSFHATWYTLATGVTDFTTWRNERVPPPDAPSGDACRFSYSEDLQLVLCNYQVPRVDVDYRMGTPCEATSDHEWCLLSLEAVFTWGQPQGLPGSTVWYLAGNHGDQVFAWGPQNIEQFLAPLDNADELDMLVGWKGYGMTHYRHAAGGYEVIAYQTRSTCPVVHERYLLFVSLDGAITEKRRHESYRNETRCISI